MIDETGITQQDELVGYFRRTRNPNLKDETGITVELTGEDGHYEVPLAALFAAGRLELTTPDGKTYDVGGINVTQSRLSARIGSGTGIIDIPANIMTETEFNDIPNVTDMSQYLTYEFNEEDGSL